MTLAPHEWLRARRHRRCLRQIDVEQRTSALNGHVAASRLSKLEHGHLPLTALRTRQAVALCQVLGLTDEEWAEQRARSHRRSQAGAARGAPAALEAPEQPVMPHEWLRAVRREKIERRDFELQTAALGCRVSAQVLGNLESGRKLLTAVRPEQVKAMCGVLGISAEEWAAHATLPRQAAGDAQ